VISSGSAERWDMTATLANFGHDVNVHQQLVVTVAARVAERMQEQLTALEFDAAEVMRYIAMGCRFDLRRLFDEQGKPRPFDELTFEEASMIESYEIILKNAKAGDGSIDEVLKVKVSPRSKWVELAAIHFQLLQQQINVSGSLMTVDERASDEELMAGMEAIVNKARARMGLPPVEALWPMLNAKR
jgi:hypothetical protein